MTGQIVCYINRTYRVLPTIPERVLAKLDEASDIRRKRNDEPLLVLTHSMGGQIIYDVVTYFLPRRPAASRPRLDFWCATASQVGLFEELKLFLVRDPRYRTGMPAPFPDRGILGGWWNVWDHNDFVSFTARGIFDDVDDGCFNSGMSGLSAHSGYLQQPSFFRAMARKLETAAAGGWGRAG